MLCAVNLLANVLNVYRTFVQLCLNKFPETVVYDSFNRFVLTRIISLKLFSHTAAKYSLLKVKQFIMIQCLPQILSSTHFSDRHYNSCPVQWFHWAYRIDWRLSEHWNIKRGFPYNHTHVD